MDPDAADITPAGRQPNRSKKEAESAPLDAQSQIDSIVLNAPVADVYAYYSRFEELPRFMTSLRDVQKIDETHFSFTSLLDGEKHTTVLQIVLRIPERRIAWQAMSDNFPRGVVWFEPLSNRTTEITVRLRSSIESATLLSDAGLSHEFQTRPGRDIIGALAALQSNQATPGRVCNSFCTADDVHLGRRLISQPDTESKHPIIATGRLT